MIGVSWGAFMVVLISFVCLYNVEHSLHTQLSLHLRGGNAPEISTRFWNSILNEFCGKTEPSQVPSRRRCTVLWVFRVLYETLPDRFGEIMRCFRQQRGDLF